MNTYQSSVEAAASRPCPGFGPTQRALKKDRRTQRSTVLGCSVQLTSDGGLEKANKAESKQFAGRDYAPVHANIVDPGVLLDLAHHHLHKLLVGDAIGWARQLKDPQGLKDTDHDSSAHACTRQPIRLCFEHA